ncbi:MAG: thioredoxin family protein [Proteobacteria bacterium]|nr:thioredoxin family protein [Pseudomonadota bacterium]
MKTGTTLLPALLALFAVTALTACKGSSGPSASAINWVTDYQAGLEKAQKTGRPVLVFFTAEWCGYCTRIKKEVFAQKEVGTASEKLVNIWVDVDENRQLAGEFGIRGIPALIFLDPEGKVLGPYNGPRNPGPIITAMNEVTAKYP